MPEFADVRDLKQLQRVFERLPDEAVGDVRKVNRAAANMLRGEIRMALPRTGGSVQHRHSESRARGGSSSRPRGRHDTRSGAMATSVRSFANITSAGVRGGGTSGAPHFAVNEFGGAVWWSRGGHLQRAMRGNSHRSAKAMRSRMGGDIGHIIPVRERSPMNHVKSWGTLSNGRPAIKSRAFPSGWYFYKTAAAAIPRVLAKHADEMRDLTRRLFSTV